MFKNFVQWCWNWLGLQFQTDKPTRINRFLKSVLYLGILLGTHSILAAEIEADSVAAISDIAPELQIQERHAPPSGVMPSDILCLSDRYWVFSDLKKLVGTKSLSFNYHGLPPLQRDQQLVILTRVDSVLIWRKLDPGTYNFISQNPQTGTGEIQLLTPPKYDPTLFTLGITVTSISASRLENLQAAIFYGPIHLSWQSRCELSNKYFQIEHRIEARGWEIIGKVAGQSLGLLPKTYYFEDLSQFGRDTLLEYRIKSIGAPDTSDYSPILRLWYSPVPTAAGFRLARVDSSSRYLNLAFQLVVNCYVQIELFDQTGRGRQILFQREMAAGCYSQMIEVQEWTLKATDFCRLELTATNGKYSFIQIQPLSGLPGKNIACE